MRRNPFPHRRQMPILRRQSMLILRRPFRHHFRTSAEAKAHNDLKTKYMETPKPFLLLAALALAGCAANDQPTVYYTPAPMTAADIRACGGPDTPMAVALERLRQSDADLANATARLQASEAANPGVGYPDSCPAPQAPAQDWGHTGAIYRPDGWTEPFVINPGGHSGSIDTPDGMVNFNINLIQKRVRK
jgi:hypothetical protein